LSYFHGGYQGGYLQITGSKKNKKILEDYLQVTGLKKNKKI